MVSHTVIREDSGMFYIVEYFTDGFICMSAHYLCVVENNRQILNLFVFLRPKRFFIRSVGKL